TSACRPAPARPYPHAARVRRPDHGTAARLSRHRRLLDARSERALAREHRSADARPQRAQRPVPSGGCARARGARGRIGRGARISAHWRARGLSRTRPLARAARTRFSLPPVNLPHEIFRAYDIRGIVGKTLTPEIARQVGRALGTLGIERGAPAFALARDGRLSGPELAAALADGLNEAGA